MRRYLQSVIGAIVVVSVMLFFYSNSLATTLPPITQSQESDVSNISRTLKIAVSLITYKEVTALNHTLTTLFNSDIMNYNVTLFAWYNRNDTPAYDYIKKFNLVKTVLLGTGENMMIVIPRIKIMDRVLQEDFDWFLEIHDDMVFPPKWFEELLPYNASDVGILMPFLLNGAVQSFTDYTPESVVREAAKVKEDTILENCIQVHPWLLKISVVRQVGYYDDAFAPQEAEDDDFYYRVIKSGYRTVAVKTSWVYHWGGKSRSFQTDILLQHKKLFLKKHGITINQAKKDVYAHCHPIVLVK